MKSPALVVIAVLLCACQPGRPVEEPAKPGEPTVKVDAAPIPSASAAPDARAYLDSAATPADTLATLRTRHGETNVVAAKVPGAEGEEFDGWILYPDNPGKRVYVYLDQQGRPEVLRILDVESTWQRSDGIRMGLRLDELARRNGKPIEFSGFGWDYGGNVSGWNGGAMEGQLADGGFGLCPPDFANDEWPAGYPEGDAVFSSALPVVIAHPPTVCTFAVIVGENAP